MYSDTLNRVDGVPNDDRISGLDQVKKSVENKKVPPASNDLNPCAQIFKSTGNVAAEMLLLDAVEESGRDFAFQELENGPLDEKAQQRDLKAAKEMIKNLSLKCLETDYDAKKAILTQKRQDNENLIEHLMDMLSSATNQAGSTLTLNRAIESLNNYSANIYVALDSLGQAYEEGKRRDATEVEFNTAMVFCPDLASTELDTLRLLTTTAYYSNSSRPPQVTSPFSQQPPSRPAGAPAQPRSRPLSGLTLSGVSSPGQSLATGKLSNVPGKAGSSLSALGRDLAAAGGAVPRTSTPAQTPSPTSVTPKEATQMDQVLFIYVVIK